MKPFRLLHAGLIAATVLTTACAPRESIAQSLTTEFPRDGWISWDVPAVENAPAWCCYHYEDKNDPRPGRCALDGKSYGYGMRDDAARTDTLRIYAKFANGEVQRVRSLAPTCEATADTPIRHLGPRSADGSVAWLRGVVTATARSDDDGQSGHPRGPARDAFAALAVHRGDGALAVLRDQAQSAANRGQRRQAVFWLGQVRGEPGVDILQPIMLGDADANIREHAAFAVALSKSPRASALLIRQGEQDTSAKVRGQAWFWLAHSKSADAEAALQSAVRRDPDSKVRQKAVFALSQLPGTRAVNALAALAEDRTLDRELRKKAVFWLGQSKAPEAMAYLEKTLLRVAQ
ncbi:MAG: HEAT repeat domain-containing protein [Burkholderiales bacterium]|nr:HEAT repeat domain-containing protein [Burkholderiales bacterium]